MTNSTITLISGGARAEIALRGAEALRWTIHGRELLWPGDPRIWNEISPILFPVVGWTRDGARVNGERYDLGLHGFARHQDFRLETQRPDFVRLALSDNAETRALYPFAFSLAVEYLLTSDGLEIAIAVENRAAAPLPYACGLHPGFRWPLAGGPRNGAMVVFERAERAEVPCIAPGGLIGAGMRSIPLDGRSLPLSDALFAHDALCFLNPASRSLKFVEDSGASMTMAFPGFAHAALWTRPGAPFLCLEAWTGYSDPEGFAGDLFEKPGMRVLQPGEKARHAAHYQFGAPSQS